jgi:hypothetical protein
MLLGWHFYGGKLKDLSFVSTQMLNTRVLRLFSASDASGIGENGLNATLTATALAFKGALAFKIL